MPEEIGRLKKRRDFLRVARARLKWATPGLVLQARRSGRTETEGEAIRVGFTASKKVGGAVERNRAKRRLRAAVREVMPGHAAPGTDYVVIARAGTLSRPFADLVRDLKAALRRLHARGPLKV